MNGTVEFVADVFLALIGLAIGSFLNVLIYRLPEGMNIAYPPSHCPKCNAKLKWYDNIPLLSYLILGGRCRTCKAKISFRYFAVELVNLLLWIAVLAVFDLSVYSVAYALLTSLLIAIFFIDAEHGIIPDSLNLAIAILGVAVTAYSVFFPVVSGVFGAYPTLWWEYLAGGAGGGGIFLAFFCLYRLIRKKEGLGGGDVKMIGALGLLLGYRKTLFCIGLSAILACLFLLGKKIAGKLNAEEPLPFGPFLAVAAEIAVFFGDVLIELYLGLF